MCFDGDFAIGAENIQCQRGVFLYGCDEVPDGLVDYRFIKVGKGGVIGWGERGNAGCALVSFVVSVGYAISCLTMGNSQGSYTPDLAICEIIEWRKHVDLFTSKRTVLYRILSASNLPGGEIGLFKGRVRG